MIKVVKKDKGFDIMEGEKEVVPFVHYSKESAIEEWVYFEKFNITKKQFLNHVRTIEEINSIVSDLNSTRNI